MKINQFLFRGLGFLLLLCITRGLFVVETTLATNIPSQTIVTNAENNTWQKIIKSLLTEKTEAEENEKKEKEKEIEKETEKMGEVFFHTHTNKILIFHSSWFNFTHTWIYSTLYPFKSKHSHHLYIFHRNILT
ncbi:MAG: hypothetical protein EAZ85_10095 [Bacteroidetes bacterium]|nr:MAG: hypothetical protein EAZ85_10095 [Bacteroidota bacterium]TAG88732.1 MAG: hypothetical protein EAZ20_07950 [Bacteroidota bacterium]